jgi:hypothetical protein
MHRSVRYRFRYAHLRGLIPSVRLFITKALRRQRAPMWVTVLVVAVTWVLVAGGVWALVYAAVEG